MDQASHPDHQPDEQRPQLPTESDNSAPLNFEFHGNGQEFFKIWIVNIFLSIITLGIFSAWAKVRTQRYFYSNTVLDGRTFGYLADPVKILKGRLVAFGLLAVYSLSWNFFPQAGMVLLVLGVLLLPAILVTATRFRLRYSAYRNVRFGLHCRIGEAYRAFTLPISLILTLTLIGYALLHLVDLDALSAAAAGPEGNADIPAGAPLTPEDLILTIFYLALLPFIPYVDAIRARLVVNHACFSDLPASLNTRVRSFYRVYAVSFMLMMAIGTLVSVFIGIGAAIFGALGLEASTALTIPLIMISALLFYAALFFASGYFRAERTNLIYGNTRFGNHRLFSKLKAIPVGWLFLSNTIAIIFSLGLLIPWSRIRMARYVLSMTALDAADLDRISASHQSGQNAMGEGMIDAFDLDLGL